VVIVSVGMPAFSSFFNPREDAEAAQKAAAADAEMANGGDEKKAIEEDVKTLSRSERWLEWYKGTWMGKTKWSKGVSICIVWKGEKMIMVGQKICPSLILMLYFSSSYTLKVLLLVKVCNVYNIGRPSQSWE